MSLIVIFQRSIHFTKFLQLHVFQYLTILEHLKNGLRNAFLIARSCLRPCLPSRMSPWTKTPSKPRKIHDQNPFFTRIFMISPWSSSQFPIVFPLFFSA